MPYLGNTAASRFVSNRAASVYSGDGSTVAFTLEQVVAQDEDVLVSVDGVIQEPSVAYAVSNGTTLTFTAAPSTNSGNNIFVYYLASQAGTVGHPSTQALSATSATFSSHLNMGDGNIIKLGAGADLQIQHNASNSIIADSGTGQLQLWSNGFRVKNAAGDESIINGDENGAVTLLHNNVAKIASASTGVNVTGGVGLGGTGAANILDDYEEGTWTPSLSGPSAQSGTWGSALIGTYTKVGRQVTLHASITGSAMRFTGTAGYYAMTGVPFAASQPTNSKNYSGSWSGDNVGVASGGSLYLNASTMYLHSSNSGQADAGVSGIGISMTYFTA